MKIKKLLAILAAATMIFACSTAVMAGDAVAGDSTTVGDSSGDGKGTNNPGTGVLLTVIPVALATGALATSGIILKKKSK